MRGAATTGFLQWLCRPRLAKAAFTARCTPVEHHTITHSRPRHAFADTFDHTRRFMTEQIRKLATEMPTLRMQVGVTHAAG